MAFFLLLLQSQLPGALLIYSASRRGSCNFLSVLFPGMLPAQEVWEKSEQWPTFSTCHLQLGKNPRPKRWPSDTPILEQLVKELQVESYAFFKTCPGSSE